MDGVFEHFVADLKQGARTVQANNDATNSPSNTPTNTPPQHSQIKTQTIGAISFVNTLPIYQGLSLPKGWQLHYAPPAELNQRMKSGEFSVSPVSSAFYLQHQDALTLLPSLSVSSYGSVDSVLFLSRKPIEQLMGGSQPILVPNDSATSVALLAHILKQKFLIDAQPRFQTYDASQFLSTVPSADCGLVIGDRALMIKHALDGEPKALNPQLKMIRDAFEGWYIMDLSNEWVEETKTPIVFAVWVAQRTFAQDHPDTLNGLVERLTISRDHFWHHSLWQKQAIERAQKALPLSKEALMQYWGKSLNYDWSAEHDRSLALWGDVIAASRPHQSLASPSIASNSPMVSA